MVTEAHVIQPEWPGDIREPEAGCWHVVNGNYNSPMFDADHCRKPCVPGTLYCEQHQREPRQTQKELTL